MTNEPEDTGAKVGAAPAPRTAPPDLRLRPPLPTVMRLSRKTVGIASAATLAMIGGAFGYALYEKGQEKPAELLITDGKTAADALAAAPKDYSDVPKLGPPLPGDLGKPILDAQQNGGVAALPPLQPASAGQPPMSAQDSAAAQARQLAAQERDAARTSRLFLAGASGRDASDGAAVGIDPTTLAGAQPNSVSEEVSTRTSPKRAFLDRANDGGTLASGRLNVPPDPHILQAGSIIPAALITGIRSDLPGQITAQVTQNVYDSPTGRILLIPQGARLIGDYDAEVSAGQSRVLLAWNRLILPDGRSIQLDRQPGADRGGFAGLQDGVNFHWGSIGKAALISTVLGIGAELGSGSDGALARALRTGTQDTINQAGQEIVKRQLGIPPTLTIRLGFPVRVIVTRDLILAPNGEGR
ncbi:MAG: TrbI/VirB10 family protein [Sphingomonadaceae bacterium]|nr:TrbI/VirB10 family protein [Sphingomonadaceae bacterium]